MTIAALVAGVPVEPDEPTAREWIREELAKAAYRSLDLPDSRPRDLDGWSIPGGPWTLVILGIIVVAVIVYLAIGLPRVRHRITSDDLPLFSEQDTSAAEHRRRAEAAATAGDYLAAVREGFRAIIRALQDRGLVDTRAGLTADEAAGEAGLVLPDLAPELRACAGLFDQVVYGGRTAGPEHHARLRALDDTAARTRPVPRRAGAGPTLVAPR